ncbi:palmitoyl-monogalactosyldiacylglycerol delta-7 desaturase, chloroplastic-like [Malania oleifera]|uniref:palmitoyl-monogalactosyldiacylglycerol delta-7 desaturase, chloroplastic-like n=1 Tax=Malania oleifera TaxID=397392 RepID=UPI0025AE946A|nr:palmitoyl-monogalactosyldiacylglycerol delta-7 desaturase, chloroplastic-like [Malania oleifera]
MALLASAAVPTAKPYPFSPLLRAGKQLNQTSFRPFVETSSSLTSTHRAAGFSPLRNRPATVVASGEGAPVVEETATSPQPASKETGDKRILLSDVVVTRPTNVYSAERAWTSLDLGTAAAVAGIHGLALFAPFTFNWDAFWVAVDLYVVTGLLGITLSYHRNLSHRSFKLPWLLEYVFAYCGLQSLQGNPIDWVSTHRHHHRFCETERDPHSPTEGFWFSHFSWLFDSKTLNEKCGGRNNVADMEQQAYYRFLEKTYIFHPIALGALLYALGGFPYVVWGMGVRTCAVYHATWLVNSGGHVWGDRVWRTGDLSRNNWFNALITFGDGWHNNHHAFEFSAKHGLEWWQFDVTWYLIKLLEGVGMASDIKLPTEAQKQQKALENMAA